MIRINLLPQKRSRRTEPGTQLLAIGMFALLAFLAAVYFLVHAPLVEEVDGLKLRVQRVTQQNQEKKDTLKDFEALKAKVAEAKEREEVILRLDNARATPAHLMHELATILTPRRTPTMTRDMTATVRNNPNRELNMEWDPKHVWITSLVEKAGEFRLEGGAQSDSDMIQLALRLQASVYFQDIIPEKGNEVVDKDTGLSYYQFTITGKVAY